MGVFGVPTVQVLFSLNNSDNGNDNDNGKDDGAAVYNELFWGSDQHTMDHIDLALAGLDAVYTVADENGTGSNGEEKKKNRQRIAYTDRGDKEVGKQICEM